MERLDQMIGDTAKTMMIVAAALLTAPSALAQDAGEAAQAAAEPVVAETETEIPWYESFNLSMGDQLQPGLDTSDTYNFQLPGSRWGFTLDVEEDADPRFDVEDVSAGAYIDVGNRFRLRGELRFSAPEDDLLLTRESEDERRPEIKFESALRF